MEKLRIALLQFDVKAGNKEKNCRTAEDLIKKAAKNADVVCLPEMFSTGFCPDIRELAESAPGPTTLFLEKLAREFKITIVGGSIPEVADSSVFNTCMIFNPGIVHRYRKIHLFNYGTINESKYFKPGDALPVSDIGVAAGTLICYDVRFPDAFRALAMNGAKIIFVPAQFPASRIEHWKTMLMARAVENQIFTVGINRVGKDESGVYNGHSIVVDPFGKIIAEGGERKEIIFAEIDVNEVEKCRSGINYLKDRRPDVYKAHGII